MSSTSELARTLIAHINVMIDDFYPLDETNPSGRRTNMNQIEQDAFLRAIAGMLKGYCMVSGDNISRNYSWISASHQYIELYIKRRAAQILVQETRTLEELKEDEELLACIIAERTRLYPEMVAEEQRNKNMIMRAIESVEGPLVLPARDGVQIIRYHDSVEILMASNRNE